MIDIDTGGTGSVGPFVTWNARESLDGTIPGRTFGIRYSNERRPFPEMGKGVVFDLDNIRTGWCWSDGTAGRAPEWRWNASITRMEPEPPAKGEQRWKRGFSIPLAYGPGPTDRAVWEQAQAGAWAAFTDFAQLLRGAVVSPQHLPVVRMTGHRKIESARGTTHVPVLGIVKWAPRPLSLTTTGAEIATEPQPASAAPGGRTYAMPERKPAPELVEDRVPFAPQWQ